MKSGALAWVIMAQSRMVRRDRVLGDVFGKGGPTVQDTQGISHIASNRIVVTSYHQGEKEIKSLCALIITEPDREKLEELIRQRNIVLARRETRRGIPHPKGKPA
jgi:hypothetical protein